MTGSEVLEMGEGDDQWTRRLIKHFGHCHLVDGSRTLIEAAQKKYRAKLTTYHCLFEELKPATCLIPSCLRWFWSMWKTQ